MKKKVIGVLVVLVLIGLWACSGSDSKSGKAPAAVSSETEIAGTETAGPETEAAETVAAETEIETTAGSETAATETAAAETTAAETEVEMTMGQRNAVGAASDYLEFSAFSRAGLFDQLTSEYGSKFPEEDAEFAISYLEENGLVDWNEQAVKAAESYLEFSSFSKEGLIDQLSSEYGSQFTREQAEYAAEQVGF